MLAQKSAVITSAGSGVGRASALRRAEKEALLVCADIRVDWTEEAVHRIEGAGGVAIPKACDVSRQEMSHRESPWPQQSSAVSTSRSSTPRCQPPHHETAIEDHAIQNVERLVSGRPISVGECAEAALFLVSDQSANVTGICLPIDEGYVAR